MLFRSEPAAAGDLISFLKALPDCRMRRGVRFPQWWMLLVAILAILSNEGSLVGIERFARRHRQVLNELLGTDFGKEPSDSTFRLLLSQLDVPGFETLLRQWMSAQPGVAERLETLVCDGKTLRGLDRDLVDPRRDHSPGSRHQGTAPITGVETAGRDALRLISNRPWGPTPERGLPP